MRPGRSAGPDGRSRGFCTEEHNNTRTDYGLVQRYVRRVNNHDYFVLRCAGASAPGSLGAAKWITDLFTPNRVTGSIPLPERINDRSRLEALVKVTATSRTGNPPWIVENTELVELYVDHQEWYEMDSCWGEITPKVITLVTSTPSSGGWAPDAIKSVYFDGKQVIFKKVNSKKDSAARCQLLAVCQIASQNGGFVNLDELAANKTFCGDLDKDSDEFYKKVKTHVSTLRKRHFHRALIDTDDGWRLTAKIVHLSSGGRRHGEPQKAKITATDSGHSPSPTAPPQPKPR